MSIIENLYRANDVFIQKGNSLSIDKRLMYQREALTSLRILGYFSMLAMEQGCILSKQYEQIARQVTDCENLLGAWINSDRKRL